MLLVLIAVIGVWVAAQQMIIARQKLNHDLFDRRFQVFKAVEKILSDIVKTKKVEDSDIVEFHQSAIASPFLFRDKVVDFIAWLVADAASMKTYGDILNTDIDDPEIVDRYKKEYHILSEKFVQHRRNFYEVFDEELSLHKFKPFSVIQMLPLKSIKIFISSAQLTVKKGINSLDSRFRRVRRG